MAEGWQEAGHTSYQLFLNLGPTFLMMHPPFEALILRYQGTKLPASPQEIPEMKRGFIEGELGAPRARIALHPLLAAHHLPWPRLPAMKSPSPAGGLQVSNRDLEAQRPHLRPLGAAKSSSPKPSQPQAHRCSHVVPERPRPRGGTSADSALPFPYIF